MGAQLVTPKTIPVFQDAQFDIFPSARAGMAGVSIAVDVTVVQPAPGGIIAAQSRPLDFDGGTAITNRFTVSVPLR